MSTGMRCEVTGEQSSVVRIDDPDCGIHYYLRDDIADRFEHNDLAPHEWLAIARRRGDTTWSLSEQYYTRFGCPLDARDNELLYIYQEEAAGLERDCYAVPDFALQFLACWGGCKGEPPWSQAVQCVSRWQPRVIALRVDQLESIGVCDHVVDSINNVVTQCPQIDMGWIKERWRRQNGRDLLFGSSSQMLLNHSSDIVESTNDITRIAIELGASINVLVPIGSLVFAAEYQKNREAMLVSYVKSLRSPEAAWAAWTCLRSLPKQVVLECVKDMNEARPSYPFAPWRPHSGKPFAQSTTLINSEWWTWAQLVLRADPSMSFVAAWASSASPLCFIALIAIAIARGCATDECYDQMAEWLSTEGIGINGCNGAAKTLVVPASMVIAIKDDPVYSFLCSIDAIRGS